MDKRQQGKLNRLARLLSFLDDYVIEVGNVSTSPSRVELDALVKNLTLHARAQAAAAGEFQLCTLRRQSLRRELWSRHLRPIAVIAQAELADTPVAAAFQYPGLGVSQEVLLERAEAIGEEAAKYRHVFLCHGLARDFVEQLQAVVDAMDRLADEREACMTRLKAATAALASGLRRAVRLVSVLDALVQSRAGGNQALRAAWAAARRGEVPDARHGLALSDVA